MQAQLKTMANYTTIRDGFQVFELLKEIKGHTFKLTDRDYPYQSVWDSYCNVFSTKQSKSEFLDRYRERFNVTIEAAEGYGCRFGHEEALWEKDERWMTLGPVQRADSDEIQGVKERCREALLAYGFTSSLGDRFEIYKKGLRADYAQGHNRYKISVVESYQMALDVMRIYQVKPKGYQGDKPKKHRENKDSDEGAAFVQKGVEKKFFFKCGSGDYKQCPCDNLKKVREREQKMKDKAKETESQHRQVQERSLVRFSNEAEEVVFHQKHTLSKEVQEYCKENNNKDLG